MSAAWLHEALRWPLHLPGHHGLEWLAILVFARVVARARYAASWAALGAVAAAVLPAFGTQGALGDCAYLIAGIGMDLAWHALPAIRRSPLGLAVVAGLCHATKPLWFTVLAVSTGARFGSIVDGVLEPWFMHFCFGCAGGLVGASLALASVKALRAAD